MKEQAIELVELDESMLDSFLEYTHALLDAGEPDNLGTKLLAEIKRVKKAGTGDERSAFAAFIQRQRDCIKGIGLPEGWVPWQAFWLVRDGRILGSCGLRFELTEALLDVGGHIGYMVRPSERGWGYATEMCRRLIEKAHVHGLTRVLITCNRTNPASARVIERCGGILDSESYSDQKGEIVRRYWIDLA